LNPSQEHSRPCANVRTHSPPNVSFPLSTVTTPGKIIVSHRPLTRSPTKKTSTAKTRQPPTPTAHHRTNQQESCVPFCKKSGQLLDILSPAKTAPCSHTHTHARTHARTLGSSLHSRSSRRWRSTRRSSTILRSRAFSGDVPLEQSRAGQGRAGQGRAGHGRAKRCMSRGSQRAHVCASL